MLASVENGPCDAAGVLALKEEGLGFAVLESEDLAVATDVNLTLYPAFPSAMYAIQRDLRRPLSSLMGPRVDRFHRLRRA